MRSALPLLFLVVSLFSASKVLAQGGVRAIFWDYMSLGPNNWASGLGLGYDQDLNDRLSLGIQGRILLSNEAKWSVSYRSAYHLADNDEASFYIGPQVAVMSYETRNGNSTLVPIGMRCGVRGGLERFYADIFAAVNYTIGASGVELTSRDPALSASLIEIGLHMGWGWDKAR